MSIMKYAAGVPVVAAVVASLYGGLSYVNGLQNTLEDNEKTIIELTMNQKSNYDKVNSEIDNMHTNLDDRISAEMDKLNIRVNNNDERLKTGREELLIEMTNFSKVIADINAKVNVLRDASYKTASMAELSALEELVRNTSDSMREFTYSIKEMERKLNGGY